MTRQSGSPAPTEHPAWLTQISEKRLPKRCKADGLTYCPSMNLIGVTSIDEQVNVYRLNGQHVLGGVYGTPKDGSRDHDEDDDHDMDDEEESREVKAIGWKADGKFLAVVCSDSTMLTSSDQQSSAVPFCFGWTTNFTDAAGSLEILRDSDGDVALESLLSCEAKISDLRQLKADLPRELMLLDIESSLPRLSTLPSTNDDQDVFSSRSSIDAIFHGKKESGDTVDVLLVAFTDGTIHLKIYDCFEIGSVDLRSSLRSSTQVKPLLHGSHPLTSMHSMLYILPDNNQTRLVVSDFAFITMSGRYLSLLASKITQMQNLLRYIKQIQTQIQLEWKNTQELPSRYMRSANMDLEEKLGTDFITAAYHLLVTGDCWEPLREFLVDILGDRGHKRWDKAVSTGYESIRRFTHECLLPALERASVHLNTLIGLSKFHKLSGILGLWTDDLQACQETIDALTIFSHKVIIHSSDELRGFTAFSRWLKLQVDLQIAEPLSQTSQDLMEKADTVDYGATSKYLLGALTKSALRSYLLPAGPVLAKTVQTGTGTEVKGSFYEHYKQLLSRHENQWREKGESDVQLPFLSDLTGRLNSQFDVVFRQIANTQRKVHLYRAFLVSKGGKITTKSISLATTSLGSGTILSIKLIDDGTVLLLWKETERERDQRTHLIQLPYLDIAGTATMMEFKSLSTDKEKEKEPEVKTPLTPLSAEGKPAKFVRHTFAPDENFEAAKLEMGSSEGRQVVCVLSSDHGCYRVYDTVTVAVTTGTDTGGGEEQEQDGARASPSIEL
ncbi:hypothetical protein KEM56_006531 [Ascosphaera pollenicola]|nr:hypothetical protein KEM56_006531 [Ascosphaera pollenicola]